ncbi:MAG: toprim domain-containing protein, partial [Muribaculum sp.]|nr:toprim domain-containing protein [Muribaculum sp.]
GTSLTEGQIRMIHRFTENVTVIYDGDAAGIKASLRGIDMLLGEGLNIKVLLLPDGDDPDSFSRKHTSSELEQYIRDNEIDFIQFKTNILLQGVENDPIARSKVIADIVRSIAVIPEPVTRNIYIKECSRRLEIDERIVSSEVNKQVKALAEKAAEKRLKKAGNESIEELSQQETADSEKEDEARREKDIETALRNAETISGTGRFLRPYEKGLLRYVLRYGMLDLCDSIDEQGNTVPVKVIDYIAEELKIDDLTFTNPDIILAFNEAIKASRESWSSDCARNDSDLMERRSRYIAEGEAKLRETETDIATIERKEKLIVESADAKFQEGKDNFAMLYIEKALSSHPDDTIRNITLELVADKHVLSKVHTKYAHVETDEERLGELVPRAIFEYKDAILECRIRKLHDDLKRVASSPDADPEEIRALMEAHVQLQRLRGEFAKYLGERIINPRK